jgi:REP element-mobilizing transposase RayT
LLERASRHVPEGALALGIPAESSRAWHTGFSQFFGDCYLLEQVIGLRRFICLPRSRIRVRQHELVFRNWGGARRGAGRKPNGARAGVSHREREAFAPRFPIHVTARIRASLPSLRRDLARRALENAFADGRERFGFRLIHYSIQTNHLHLIVEAADRRALSRGMQGLSIRIARALNRLWKRNGPVFADRYHARILRSPREVRYALAYALLNARKHGIHVHGIDPYTSGAAFDGWQTSHRASTDRDLVRTPGHARAVGFNDATKVAATPARTWLLRVGWRRWGLIRVDEVARG